jgi:maleate cis-trans isomerase
LGDFYIDVASNGDIHISGNNFKMPINIQELNGIIQEIANPVIEHINDFLRKNGYEIKKFSDIRNKDIEIEYLKYVSSIKIKKEIDLAKYKGCLSSIFEMDGATASLI